MKNNNFFAMLSRMKYINRWGLMRNTITENIAEHSLDVAIIAHALVIIKNTYFGGNMNPERVVMLSLYHDTTEIITGDLPTPIKYFAPEIKNAYKNVEYIAAEQLLASMPEEMRPAYETIMHADASEEENWKIVKAADKLSAYIKCIEEKRMGNMDFEKAEKTLAETINSMNMPEVDYFMDKFIPAYSLTLDEQA
ncbi:MAG: 5'-deoxynucleotidase [Eubacterium sp.]